VSSSCSRTDSRKLQGQHKRSIVLTDDGGTYGVDAWRSNPRDRRIYKGAAVGDLKDLIDA
jgi:hypothetical protein